MKMSSISFQQVDNFGSYIMKYVTWCYYGMMDNIHMHFRQMVQKCIKEFSGKIGGNVLI